MIKLKEKYNKEAVPEMKKKFGYKSVMAAPKIKKVVVNSGFGRLVAGKANDEQRKIAVAIMDDLALICGQKAVPASAKKSIASFKTRQGQVIGAFVTLRGNRMYDFLDRVIHVSLPRSRDFQGINSQSFDGRGNLTFAFKEQIVFPEILPEKSKINFGFEVTVTTNAKTREEGIELLRLLGFPIKLNPKS